MRDARGVALIVTLALLALLSLLATTFANLAAIERTVARNALDAARARLLAQAGVETAVTLLRQELPRIITADDPLWTGSGHDAMESGTYAPRGDLFRLRITDANACININDGVRWGRDHSTSRNLRRILNLLGAQPGVDVPRLGDMLLDGRPASGYVHKADTLRALGYDREAYRRANGFLTTAAWTDPAVANPVPLSGVTAGPPFYAVEFARPGGFHRYGHQRNYKGDLITAPLLFFNSEDPRPAHNAIWGRDSLHPQWIEIVSRSPVNINTAPREVLAALIIDLEGFFLTERRRKMPPAREWADTHYTYDASGNEGDECGFIYRTFPFIGPGGRHEEGIPAASVVDEILACRERRPSPHIEGLDYATSPFGGPFRTWAQFDRFVDRLVEGGLLADPRTAQYWDYDASGSRVPSSVQLRLASQAIADTLKANFNPNLHLNEINPDRNLFTHVDKTDLLVNSTEFCFLPMGTFEIDSTGRLTRLTETVASRRAVVQVKLYDAVRETSQKDFTAEDGRGLETGPEPDNGPAPAENTYEGHLQLPTSVANFIEEASIKPRNTLWTTVSDPAIYPGAVPPEQQGGRHLGSVIHAHYQLDHAAHHHASGAATLEGDAFRLDQGGWTTVAGSRCCLNRNWEDRTESIASPYGPVDSTRVSFPGRYRLARSFSLLDGEPEGFEYAPSDLHADGAYVERHSAFGYWIEENVSFNFNEGTAAFWMKPGFFPEMTGKSRTLLSMSRYHATAPGTMNPSPFALFFIPGQSSTHEMFRPCSMAFGFGFSSTTGYNREMMPAGGDACSHVFAVTPSLHEDVLRAHSWVHVAVTWRNKLNTLPSEDNAQIYLNGRVLPGTARMAPTYDGEHGAGQLITKTPRWDTHSLQVSLPGQATPSWCVNSIRLGGEPSVLVDGAFPGETGFFPRNFSADATFDEFYLWDDRWTGSNGGLRGAQTLWRRGRYRVPGDAGATFTSREFRMNRRVLGVSWTERAEDYDASGPVMYDYSTIPPTPWRPEGATIAGVEVEVDGTLYEPCGDDGFSRVPGPGKPGPVRYRITIKAGGVGTILLATPVVDDVTLFFEAGEREILSWVEPEGANG